MIVTFSKTPSLFSDILDLQDFKNSFFFIKPCDKIIFPCIKFPNFLLYFLIKSLNIKYLKLKLKYTLSSLSFFKFFRSFILFTGGFSQNINLKKLNFFIYF